MLVALHLEINTVDEPGHESDDFFIRESLLPTKDCRRVDDFTGVLVAGYSIEISSCVEIELWKCLDCFVISTNNILSDANELIDKTLQLADY